MLTDNSQKRKLFKKKKIQSLLMIREMPPKTKMSYIFYQIDEDKIFDSTMLLV